MREQQLATTAVRHSVGHGANLFISGEFVGSYRYLADGSIVCEYGHLRNFVTVSSEDEALDVIRSAYYRAIGVRQVNESEEVDFYAQAYLDEKTEAVDTVRNLAIFLLSTALLLLLLGGRS